MLNRMCRNLTTVISEVLETMFFVFPEPRPLASLPRRADFVGAMVSVSGPALNCQLELLAQAGFLNQVAVDFLGLDEGDADPDQCQDVLKEIANMVAGNLVNLCDPEATLALGIPEITGTGLENQKLDDCVQVFAYSDGGGLLLAGVRDLSGAAN